MRTTKRRPATIGKILVDEFLEPRGIEINELAFAMGVHRNSVSRLVNDRGVLTAPMAIRLAAALGTSPEFWLNIQHAIELWDVRHGAYRHEACDVRPIPARMGHTGHASA